MRELHASLSAPADGSLESDSSHAFTREYGYQDEEFARYGKEMFRTVGTLLSGRTRFQAYRKYQKSGDTVPSQSTMSA